MIEIDKIYNEDCLVGMQRIPDNSVDLIITSPPYNIGNDHHIVGRRFKTYEDDMPERDYQDWQINVLNECYRILKEGGSIMYNHKNRIKDGVQISPYEWLFKTKLTIKQEIVWFNRSPNFDKIRFYPMTERIFWLSKGSKTHFYNSISHHDVFNNSEWPSVGTNAKHKRAFPIELAQSMVLCFPDAEIILDPFIGSGTTAIAAIKEKRHYVGFELNEEYYNLACERIKAEQAQPTLF